MVTVGVVQIAVHQLLHHPHHLVQSALPLGDRLLELPVSSLSSMLGSPTQAAQLLVAMLHGATLKWTLLVLVSEGHMETVGPAQLAVWPLSQPQQQQQLLQQQPLLQLKQEHLQQQQLQLQLHQHLLQSVLPLGARLLELPVSFHSSMMGSAIAAAPLLVAMLHGATLKLTLLVLESKGHMETVGLAQLALWPRPQQQQQQLPQLQHQQTDANVV